MKSIIELTAVNVKAITRHLKELSTDSKRMRFFASVSDNGIDAYVSRIDWDLDTCFGVFDGQELIGFVHLAFIDDDQRELGISVAEQDKGSGIGSALMQRVITWCKATGVTKLIMECLCENEPMQIIARKLGMRLVNDKETAIAQAALQTTFPERIREIQKNMIYENIALIDRSFRSFYNQVLIWGMPNVHK